jgi:hypothetical protein
MNEISMKTNKDTCMYIQDFQMKRDLACCKTLKGESVRCHVQRFAECFL